MTHAGGTVRLCETGSRTIVAVPYMPSRSSRLGLGRSISTRMVRVVGSSDSAMRAHGPRERLASEGIDGELGRVAHVRDDDVAVGNLHDHPHQVGSLDGQERRLDPLGRRANEGPGVEGPVGHDAVEGGDDLGVIDVDAGLGQPGLGHADGRLGLGERRRGPARPWRSAVGELGFRGHDRQPGGPLGGGGRIELERMFSSTSRGIGGAIGDESFAPVELLLGEHRERRRAGRCPIPPP